jgi:hypothetical protein
MTMQSYGSTYPSSLVSALNQQRGVSAVQPLSGGDALAFAKWQKGMLASVRQHFRAGHTSAPRMEVVLADVVSHLSGSVELWHLRAWRLAADLHLCMMADWVTCGEMLLDRATRCRQAVRAVAVDDLVGSMLLEVLRWARALHYLYHPGTLPVVKERVALTDVDGTQTLLTEERMRGAVEQAFLDDFKTETHPHLLLAFYIPLGETPAERYSKELAQLSVGPPLTRTAHNVLQSVEEGDEGDSRPQQQQQQPQRQPQHNPFAVDSPAATPAAAVPGGGPPLGVPSSSRWPWQRQQQGPAEIQASASESGQGSEHSSPGHPPFSQRMPPTAARPAATAQTARTVVTRQYTRAVHPEYPAVRQNCATAGEVWVPSGFMARHTESESYLETLPLFDKFSAEYSERLLLSDIPHVEDTYMSLFMWHPRNKPSALLVETLTHLVPEPQSDKKDRLGAMHKWDVRFHEHLSAVLPWHPELLPGTLYRVYMLGMMAIDAVAFNKVVDGLAQWDAKPLAVRTAKAREALHKAASEAMEWREGAQHLKLFQPAASTPTVKDAVVDKAPRDRARSTVRFAAGAALHLRGQQRRHVR